MQVKIGNNNKKISNKTLLASAHVTIIAFVLFYEMIDQFKSFHVVVILVQSSFLGILAIFEDLFFFFS
tara:strand:- start:503 stop:706 length:204 start_codon:yes stop_codon:yes gene_type:complete